MDPNRAIEIVYPNNNNNNNNNIIIIIINIIIIIKRKKIIKRRGGERRERESALERENIYFLFFLFFASFSDIRKSDCRFLSGLKEKLIYAMRVTRGHQKVGVSTNSVR